MNSWTRTLAAAGAAIAASLIALPLAATAGAAARPASGPVPSGFKPRSVTFVSASDGWVLGDSGRHWRTNLQLDDGGKGWSDFGFTTANQGVAVEGLPAVGSHLYITYNAGRTWHRVKF